MARSCAALWPEVPVTLSHALNPIPREYRRTVATAIDASLHGIVPAYLGRLESAVREAGFSSTLLVANCQGGMMTVGEIAARPIHAVMSGPTLAPIAALALSDEPDIVVIDMGGTTFDVSAIRARSLIRTTEAPIVDDLLGLPKIDVRSVGAGGGSIAWVDSGGLLRVGPVSAGADPGPAAYGRGGTRPTVTDANLVLGLLDPGYFLGGRLPLDAEAAQLAVATVADALGLGVAEAAYAIHVASNENMIAAIEDITVNEGIDPRESVLVAGGGATACHIGEMARALGIARFMVPGVAAGLSAFGGLVTDIRGEETATLHTSDRHFALDAVNRTLASLRERAERFLERAGVPAAERRYEYAFQARYKYQSWEIEALFEPARRRARRPTMRRRSRPRSTTCTSASTPSAKTTARWSSRPGPCAPSAPAAPSRGDRPQHKRAGACRSGARAKSISARNGPSVRFPPTTAMRRRQARRSRALR